jgi:hypothetical protein
VNPPPLLALFAWAATALAASPVLAQEVAVGPCELPALATLTVGNAAYAPESGFGGFTGSAELALTPLFPNLGSAGYLVLAVTPIDVVAGGPREYAVLLTSAAEKIEPFQAPERTDLGLVACEAGAWQLLAPPYALATEQSVQILDGERLAMPGGGVGTSLLILQADPRTMELQQHVYVVGARREMWPGIRPKDAAFGILAIVDNAGAQVLQMDGTGSYWREDVHAGSGWQPMGDELAYVALRTNSAVEGVASLGVLGMLGATGFHTGVPEQAWLLLGKGKPPGFCGPTPPALPCRILDPAGFRHEGTVPFTWLAGPWTTAAAARQAVTAAGGKVEAGKWFVAGDPDLATGKGPDGKKPLRKLELGKAKK